MRPSPIKLVDVPEGARRTVVAAPSGDLTDAFVGPVEALVEQVGVSDGELVHIVPRMSVRLVLEDGDLERLAAGAPVWIGFLSTQLPVFDVRVGDD